MNLTFWDKGRVASPFFVTLLTLLAGAPLSAGDFKIGLPVDCTLGDDCYIQRYFDRDLSNRVQDYNCGIMSGNGHGGVDFAVPDLATMAKGVPVIASAPGTVVALRDEMPDISSRSPDAPDLAGRDCGNGVVIDHGEGWRTQYCHMKLGSVSVEVGQEVAMGAALGEIGMSGRASFPHLHLTLRKGDKKVDPFNPDPTASCAIDGAPESVWLETPEYATGGLLKVGFADHVPTLDEVRRGLQSPDFTVAETRALVVWGYAFGGQTGDEIEIIFEGPEGEIGRHKEILPKWQPFFLRGYGKKTPVMGWLWGAYTGIVIHRRGDEELSRKVVTTIIQ